MRARAEKQFDGQSLREVAAGMRKKGGFMRVYWSGAWYFLALDIRLRQQSGGKNNLDMALRKLNECCADQHLSVRQMVSKLDELNGVLLFEQLYTKVEASTRMPDFDTLFASVGVTVDDGKVALQGEGPGARLRQQMAQPKAL
jgi:predicted metalloprotease with PDZ domain